MTERKPGFINIFLGPYYEYLKRLLPLIGLTSFLFAASLVMGFYLGDQLPTEVLTEAFKGLPNPASMSPIQFLFFIFVNNAGKSLIFMFCGLLFGLIPLIFVVINGFVVGWVSHELVAARGLIFTLAGLVPHGVIEIPAILVSMAIGMSLGYHVVNRIRGSSGLGLEVGVALRFFLSRIAPALMLAAAIEVAVTPLLLSLVG